MARKFSTGAVLSVVTSKMVSPNGMSDIYDIMSYLVGCDLFTHQLPAAQPPCRETLLKQYPQLADIDASGVGRDNWKEWVAEQIVKLGEEFEVKSIAEMKETT